MSARQVITALEARGLILATAESCTGGLIAGAITDIAGSSAVFHRGYVAYSNRAKREMLSVGAATLEEHGAVSEPVAAEMAWGAWRASGADVAIAVTGIAGPGGSGTKPEGRVCFGLCLKGKLQTETVEFGALGRAEVRAATVAHALALVLDRVERDLPDRPA